MKRKLCLVCILGLLMALLAGCGGKRSGVVKLKDGDGDTLTYRVAELCKDAATGLQVVYMAGEDGNEVFLVSKPRILVEAVTDDGNIAPLAVAAVRMEDGTKRLGCYFDMDEAPTRLSVTAANADTEAVEVSLAGFTPDPALAVTGEENAIKSETFYAENGGFRRDGLVTLANGAEYRICEYGPFEGRMAVWIGGTETGAITTGSFNGNLLVFGKAVAGGETVECHTINMYTSFNTGGVDSQNSYLALLFEMDDVPDTLLIYPTDDEENALTVPLNLLTLDESAYPSLKYAD